MDCRPTSVDSFYTRVYRRTMRRTVVRPGDVDDLTSACKMGPSTGPGIVSEPLVVGFNVNINSSTISRCS